MRLPRLGRSAVLLLLLPLANGRASDPGPSPVGHGSTGLDALARMSPEQLGALYRQLPPAPLLRGRVRGRALVRPGTSLGPALSRSAGLIWQGKVFRGDGTAINRFFGLPAIEARVLHGPSWMDGAAALVLDYEHTSHVYAKYRDEIRQVAPGLYLGVMYERTTPCPTIAMFFALEQDCR
jgi:hypothetical protein